MKIVCGENGSTILSEDERFHILIMKFQNKINNDTPTVALTNPKQFDLNNNLIRFQKISFCKCLKHDSKPSPNYEQLV